MPEVNRSYNSPESFPRSSKGSSSEAELGQNRTDGLNEKQLNQELREIQRQLSIPDSLKLPPLALLFNYISGENASNEELLKIDSNSLDHVYFVKREKHHDGIIFLINDKKKQSLETYEIQSEIAPVVNKIFTQYPELGKIITIPLKVDSLTDVLKILNEKPKTETERDNRVALLKSKLEIGSSQTIYPEHKKNYPNHVELVLSNFFEKFKKIERVSRPDFDLFVYNLNKQNQKLIVDFQDSSKPLIDQQTINPVKSQIKKQYNSDLQHRYKDAPILKISTHAERDLGENFQIEDYKKSGSKTDTKLSITASVNNNLYNLELDGKAKNITEITDNAYFQELKTQAKSFLPEKTGERGEKIVEALFKHLGADAKLMSSNPGHRYDLKIEMNEKFTDSPLKLLQNSPQEILAEIKTSKDDYPSIRSLTVNQATRFQDLHKNQIAIIAKVVLNDNAEHAFIKAEEIFKDYPPKFIENKDGFAVLKPDPEKSKDTHSQIGRAHV